jgi:hypothetical protein
VKFVKGLQIGPDQSIIEKITFIIIIFISTPTTYPYLILMDKAMDTSEAGNPEGYLNNIFPQFL